MPGFGLAAFIQHFTLRFWLWRAGCTPAPWRYVAFLDDAVDQLLLGKIGGGYVFRHPLLQEYFARVSNAWIAAYRLGLQFLKSKNYVEAVNQFKQAQVSGNGSFDILYTLGRAYRLYGQSVKDKDKNLFTENMKLAAVQFEQAVALKRNAIDAYFQLGMTYHDLGLYTQAIKAFKNALQYAPDESAIYYQLGWVSMDQLYDQEAEAYFLEGLKINPDHPLILIALGRLYNRMNQAQAAISVLSQVTQREPTLWEGWYELGRAHMRESKWKLALSALEQAQQWNFEESNIYSAMASCYLKTNKKDEARQMVSEALKRNPNNAEANRLQKHLLLNAPNDDLSL